MSSHGHTKVYESTGADEHVEFGVGHETTDIRLRPILMLGLALVVIVVVGNILLIGLYAFETTRRDRADSAPAPLAEPDRLPPSPRLQAAPSIDLQTMMEDHNRILNNYGWVDQPGGAVRIPIERAMAMVIKQGLPVRPGYENEPWPGIDEGTELESEGGQPSTGGSATESETP